MWRGWSLIALTLTFLIAALLGLSWNFWPLRAGARGLATQRMLPPDRLAGQDVINENSPERRTKEHTDNENKAKDAKDTGDEREKDQKNNEKPNREGGGEGEGQVEGGWGGKEATHSNEGGTKAKPEKSQRVPWTWMGVLSTLVVGFVYLLYPGLICFVSVRESAWKRLRPAMASLRAWPPSKGYTPVSTYPEEILDGVLAEVVVVVVVMPLLGFGLAVGMGWATGLKNTPGWMVAIFIPFVLRTKLMEAHFVRRTQALERPGEEEVTALDLIREDFGPMKQCKTPSPNFTFSAGEMFDGATDGMAAGVAFNIDAEIHQRFVASWSQGVGSVFAPFLDTVHLWGLMTIVLVVASLVQLVTGVMVSVSEGEFPTIASLAGMGSLAHRSRGEQTTRIILVGIARFIYEGMLQLLLQTSLLMALGKGLSAQPLVLLSVMISMGSAAKMWVMMVASLWETRNQTRTQAKVLSLGSIFGGAAALAWNMGRLAIIELCPAHMGGLLTGCVAF